MTHSPILRYAASLAAVLLLSVLLGAVPAAAFRDVPPDHWGAEPIGEMERRGYVAGYADGTFRPANPVTYAQFVTIAARCAGLEPVQAAETHWAAGTMAAALRAGWYDWDECPPTGERYDQPISRVLAVKIVMGSLLPEVRGDYLTESAKIRDFDQLDGRYYESVLGAYAAGVVQGDGAGRFNPHGGLTRAAACALVYRALGAADRGDPGTAGTGQNETGQNGTGQSRTGQNGTGQSGTGPNGTGQNGTGKSGLPGTRNAVSASPATGPAIQTAQGGVSENGWLQVKGTQLLNEIGEPVVLRGLSSHGIQWYGQFASEAAIANTAAWGANLFRVAMYTAEGGYLSDPAAMERRAFAAVDAAIARNLYVILDWHILSDGNPQSHADQAAAFFARAAERYRDCPAVLYEICNEPNGNVDWEQDIKPYAERLVSVIREKSPRAVVLIGTGTWSQDIHTAARSPLDGENLLYTFHFYAGTHGADLRQRLRDAAAEGLPVFVTEWGTSRADGDGGVYADAAGEWLDLLDELGISWANWSLCDKAEASAALKPGTDPAGPWTEADFSESGRLVFARLRAGRTG